MIYIDDTVVICNQQFNIIIDDNWGFDHSCKTNWMALRLFHQEGSCGYDIYSGEVQWGTRSLIDRIFPLKTDLVECKKQLQIIVSRTYKLRTFG